MEENSNLSVLITIFSIFRFNIVKKTHQSLIIFLSIFFIVYFAFDFINTHIIFLFPQYSSIYGNGVSDLDYFDSFASLLINGKFNEFFANSFTGGILAPFFYVIPSLTSDLFNLNLGFSYRIFYLLILIFSSYLLFFIAKFFFTPIESFFISLSYLLNPFIFFESVWAGSEEILSILLFSIALITYLNRKYEIAIFFVILFAFYKFYLILAIPFIFYSIPTIKRKIRLLIILITTGIFILALLITYLPNYVDLIVQMFITNTPARGKGIFGFLNEYGFSFSQNESFYYLILIIIILLITIILLMKSNEIIRFGIIFQLFFILYPVFYASYLILPIYFLTLLLPKSKKLIISFFTFFIFVLFSEFAFNTVDSPYALLNIEYTPLLVILGIIALIIMYIQMIYWLIFCYVNIYKSKKQEFTNLFIE